MSHIVVFIKAAADGRVLRYFAIVHPTFYLHHRATARGAHSPQFDVVLAFFCGMVLQVPRFFYSEVRGGRTYSIMHVIC